MKDKTIAIFTGFYLPHLGGVERYTEKISSEFIKNGNKVIVVTCNYNNMKSFEKVSDVNVYRLDCLKIFKNRFPIIKHNKNNSKILKKLSEENIDYVMFNTRFYKTSKLACDFANKYSIPVICIEHGSSYMSVNNPILDFFGHIYERFITYNLKKKVDSFYAVSYKSLEWLKTFHINGKGVIYNSVDLDDYKKYKKYIKSSPKEKIILYSGRVIREKKVDLLLDAFCKLKNKYNNIKLYIAGDGECLDELKKKYVDDSIFFAGKLNYSDLLELYCKTDIFVHPSDYPEGLPTVLLEAGLMKCALLATDRGGTKEVIGNNEFGVIIEPTVESIYTNIENLLNDDDKMNELKNKAHDRVVSQFTWQKTVEDLSLAFEENDNTRIYIASHKNISFPNQLIYKPIRVGSAISDDDYGFIRDDTGKNISIKNKNYCELTAAYWIMNNNRYDITGLVHYRRYFIEWYKRKKIDNAINGRKIHSILKKYDIIVPNKTFIIKHNNEQSWSYDHNKIDYDNVRKVIKKIYPDYIDAFEKFSKSKTLYICNMFIARKEIFDSYYKWLFDVLFELEKVTDLSNYDDYNKRLYGFMSERLFNVWLIKNSHLKVKRIPVYNINKKIKNQYLMIN